jgi:hypothetical protein
MLTLTRRILAVPAFLFILATAVGAAEFRLKLPRGLQEQAAYVPDDNPLTLEKIALGKQLFWDKRWSRNGTVACVSCHDPGHGWADPRQFSLRFDGKPTPPHSPTLVNRLFSDTQHRTCTTEACRRLAKSSRSTIGAGRRTLGCLARSAARVDTRRAEGPRSVSRGAQRRSDAGGVERASASAVVASRLSPLSRRCMP